MGRRNQKRRAERGRIHWVDGKPIVDEETARICRRHKCRPGDVFGGEMMVCLICGRRQRSDPRVESQWRAIRVNATTTYYFCPAEFPPDRLTTRQLFKIAYQRAMLATILAGEGQPLTADIFRPIDWASDL